jgi:hypothetical protein
MTVELQSRTQLLADLEGVCVACDSNQDNLYDNDFIPFKTIDELALRFVTYKSLRDFSISNA